MIETLKEWAQGAWDAVADEMYRNRTEVLYKRRLAQLMCLESAHLDLTTRAVYMRALERTERRISRVNRLRGLIN